MGWNGRAGGGVGVQLTATDQNPASSSRSHAHFTRALGASVHSVHRVAL